MEKDNSDFVRKSKAIREAREKIKKKEQARKEIALSAELRKKNHKKDKYDFLVILACLVVGFTLGVLSTWIVYLSRI